MNPDEAVFLSAYLDGELGPEPRLRAESAVAADPALAEELRGLSAVHELVGGLSRPPLEVDLSAAVVARLDRRRGEVAPWVRGALRLAAAAAVAIAGLGLALTSPAFRARQRAAGAPRVVPPPLVVDRDARPTPAPAATPETTAPRPAPPASTEAVALAPGDAERARDLQSQRVRRLLDSPSLRTVFFLTDVVGGKTSKQVNTLLDSTPRRFASYVCLTVAPGVSPDPKHPGPAKVFVVVMDDLEMSRFRDDVKKVAEGVAVEEAEPQPEPLTQLADVGQIAVFPGRPAADVFVPSDAAALKRPKPDLVTGVRTDDPSPSFLLPDPSAALGEDAVVNHDGPTPEQERSAPVHPTGNVPASGPERAVADATPKRPVGPARPQRPSSVVLVWVSEPATAGR